MNQNKNESPFLPTCSLENLRFRAVLLRRLRSFFDDREFIEVETPLLSRDVVVDRYIEPIAVNGLSGVFIDDAQGPFWLQTSPEFAMKRLLVAGATSIYQIAKAFRNAERGEQHNPEFTMLEWYRVGDDYEAGRKLLGEFAKFVFQVQQFEQRSYTDTFVGRLGVCPFRASVEELAKIANQRTKARLCSNVDRDEVLNVLLSELVEPELGQDCPLILYDFPSSQSALAKVRTDEFPVAERYELYFRGLEIANGYHELVDADELSARNRRINGQRVSDGRQALPSTSHLLNAMHAGMPACCGVAVGVDRLMMLLLGASQIDDVIPFPIERA